MMSAAASPTQGSDPEAVDPVCGEVFPPELAVFHSDHEGTRYHFCSKTCKEDFDADPAKHQVEHEEGVA